MSTRHEEHRQENKTLCRKTHDIRLAEKREIAYRS